MVYSSSEFWLDENKFQKTYLGRASEECQEVSRFVRENSFVCKNMLAVELECDVRQISAVV
jgi:hypothetical protein